MGYSLRCPVCRVKFPWDPEAGFPDTCPNEACDSQIGHNRADDDIAMPSIRSARTAVADKVYRDMEAGSEVRAQAAADMAGVPVEEMSGLKITDLRDTKHEGDVAAPPVVNEVSRFMEANPGIGGFQAQGNAYAGNVRSGPFPNQGARTLLGLQSVSGAAGGRVT